MLSPEERVHLLELVRPPDGFRLDLSVGTTFSLDLISALMLPLAFTFGWEREGEDEPNPLAILESLREHGHRFTVFCQSGQIRLPPKYPPLVTFLESCIYDIQPRRQLHAVSQPGWRSVGARWQGVAHGARLRMDGNAESFPAHRRRVSRSGLHEQVVGGSTCAVCGGRSA